MQSPQVSPGWVFHVEDALTGLNQGTGSTADWHILDAAQVGTAAVGVQ
jgi:hypothetical protein